MNYLQKIVSSIASIKSGSWDSIFLKNLETQYFGDQIDNKPYKLSQLVYVCISTTARAISQVPLMVMKPTGVNPKTRKFWTNQIDFINRLNYIKALSCRVDVGSEKMIDKLVKDGELQVVEANNTWQMLLDKPNPYVDGTLFKDETIGRVLLDGNVWYVPFPPDSKMPLQIWIVAKESMEPITDKVTGHLVSWKYRPKGLQFSHEFKPEEVMHMKLWNPYNSILGQAPLEAGRIDIRTDYKASVYNEKFFDDGAVPEGIVYTEKKIGADKKSRTEQEIESRHKGYRKSHRIMMLDQALKFQRIGLSQEEMNFKDLKFASAAAVMQCFGMKKAILSVTDDLNYATAKEQKKSWWEDTNLPLMRMISGALNSGLFQNLPYIVRWDKSAIEALQQDYGEKVKIAIDLWRMGKNFFEINDMLELGFDETDADKVGYISNVFKPVSDDGTLRPEPEPVVIPTPVVQPNPEQLEEEKEKPKQISYQSKSTKTEEIWDKLQEDMQPLMDRFESRVKRSFYEMRKSVIGMANGHRYEDQKGKAKAIPTPQQFLHDIDGVNFQREKDLLDDLAKSVYEDSVKLGAMSVGEELGISIAFDVVDPMVLQYISVRRLKVKGVIDTVKRQLRKQIHDGMQEGESIDQISKRIKDVFNVSSTRAKTIARTEVIGTTNFGRYAQMQHTGFTHKIWFTASDERVRHSHGEMNGKKVEIGNHWTFSDGSSVRYPGDYAGRASQVINCRCVETVDPESFDASRLGPISQTDVNNLANKES